MKLITQFCLNLPINTPKNVNILSLNSIESLNTDKDYLYPNKNKIVLDISKTNILFYQILPFFERYKFFSRKGLDFQIWSIILKLRYLDYIEVESIKLIMLELAKNMNDARYLNKKDQINELIGKINKIINNYPCTKIGRVEPFHIIKSNESIIENYPKKEIYVYDKNNLLEGSPFFFYKICCNSY